MGNTPSNPQVFNGNNLNISGDSGFPALIGVIGSNDDLSGGSLGNDTMWSIGDSVSLNDTTNGNLFGIIGNHDALTGGPGGDTMWAIGNNEFIQGGAGSDLIGLIGNNSSVNGGAGNDTVYLSGNDDTVNSGTGKTQIAWNGNNHAFTDNSAGTYQDTIVGFNQTAGDTIKLSGGDTAAFAVGHQQSLNGGADTLVTLNDGSTILLKGVTSVGTGFFS